MLATSSGLVKLPVAKPPIAGDDLLARGRRRRCRSPWRRSSATPCSPSQRSVATGPGRDRVDPDPLRPELLRERFRQVDQRRLGGAVVEHARVGLEEGIDRGDVDDRTRACLDHRRQRRTGRPQGDEEVHLQRPLELLVAGAEEAVEALFDGADVVDEDVDAAALLEGPADQVRPGRPPRQVARDRGHAARSPRGSRPRREPAKTKAPSAASSRVTASPIPLPAPVTTATLPSRPRSIRRSAGRSRARCRRISARC